LIWSAAVLFILSLERPLLLRRKQIGRTIWRRYDVAVRNLILPIIVEADSDGYFVSCPTLQGCYSQGDTYEEVVENIKDAIRLHIEDRLA
jgi:predicted RNase H-like HicB family nuclease